MNFFGIEITDEKFDYAMEVARLFQPPENYSEYYADYLLAIKKALGFE